MKVFWSWQSDRPGKVCRHFVRDALKDALDELSSELDLESSNRPELDHDTKNAVGMAPIADTIFHKIESAGAFVGDITSVASTETREHPNPNVLIELGWAWSKLGEEKVVLVANKAFGPSKAEQLPFDIRHRRAVIFYNLPEDASTDQIKEQRKLLSRALKAALAGSLAEWLVKAVNRHGILTPYRRPILTPLVSWISAWPARRWPGLQRVGQVRVMGLFGFSFESGF